MNQKLEFAEMGEVSKFYYPSRNAKIYSPPDLAEDIEKYFEACFWVADIHRKYGGTSTQSSNECKRHIDTEIELAPKIEKRIINLLKIK